MSGTGLSPAGVRDLLRGLAATPPDLFGAEEHGFRLNPVVSEGGVAAFEFLHGGPSARRLSRVPHDDREWWRRTRLWDGRGAGLEPWPGPDHLWGSLAMPFPLVEAWNQQEGAFDVDGAGLSRVDGAMPISHEGCGHLTLLVVTGFEAGKLWYDSRVSDGGMGPVLDADRRREDFAHWYQQWLSDAAVKGLLRHVRSSTRLERMLS